MKTEIVAVGAAKYLIDLRFQCNVHRVLRFFNDRIKNDESTAVFQYTQNLLHHGPGIAEVMKRKGDKRPIKGVRFEWQSVRGCSGLAIRNRIVFMLVADIEHREGLIHSDNASGLQALCERSRNASRPGRKVKNEFMASQGEHFDQLFRQVAANAAKGSVPVVFRSMLRIVKARRVFAVVMTLPMNLLVIVIMIMRMTAGRMPMLVRMGMLVIVRVFVTMVAVFMAVTMSVGMVV